MTNTTQAAAAGDISRMAIGEAITNIAAARIARCGGKPEDSEGQHRDEHRRDGGQPHQRIAGLCHL